MKPSYRILIAILVVIFIARGSTFVSFAEFNLPSYQVGFCRHVNNLSFDTQIAQRIAKFRDNHRERMGNLLSRRNRQDDDLQARWQSWLQNREQQLTQLRSLAHTDEERKIVEEFINIIRKTAGELHVSIENAVIEYRNKTDNLISNQQNIVVMAVDAYYFLTKSAIARAKADCASGRNSDTVKAEFITDMHEAKVQLQNAQGNLSVVNNQINNFASNRDQTIRESVVQFTKSINEARVELVSSLF